MKSASSNTLNFMELNKFTDDNLLSFSRIFVFISKPPDLIWWAVKNLVTSEMPWQRPLFQREF